MSAVLLSIEKMNGQMILCADHGNCEQLVDYFNRGAFHSRHNQSGAVCLISADPFYIRKEGGCLANLAPTLIDNDGIGETLQQNDRPFLRVQTIKCFTCCRNLCLIIRLN